MKIDWKKLSKTKGYKSLKSALINDLMSKRSSRRKDEYYKHFNWVIGRAKHYAVKKNVTIESILNEWESKRGSWWLNYYQECWQPKIKRGEKESVS